MKNNLISKKEAYHIYQKTQDTIVHRFSENCIHRLRFVPHVREEKCGQIQKRHSERVSVLEKQSQARMAEARGSKKTCRCTSYTQRVSHPMAKRRPRTTQA